jgi:hypothetical protein
MLMDLRNDGETVEEVALTADEIVALVGSLPDAKARALASLAARRWLASQAFSYDGVTDAPADSALAAVTGVVVASQFAPITEPMTWKLAPGEFRAWSADDVIAYGMAIRDHVQACFDNEKALADAIDAAADFAALSAVDLASGWPT